MTLERRDIDAKYKWDLTKMYPTREAFDNEFKLLESKIREYKKPRYLSAL